MGGAQEFEQLTVGALQRSLGLGLAADGAGRYADRPVRGVWLMAPGMAAPDPGQDLHGLLVVLAASDRAEAKLEPLLQGLAERRVAAVAHCLGPEQDTAAALIARCAARLDLPVLTLPVGVDPSGVAQFVSDERYREGQARGRVAGELLARLNDRPDAPDAPRRLVDWLARTVDGQVTLLSATGKPLVRSPAAGEEPGPIPETAARVADRTLGSAALHLAGLEVRMLPVGRLDEPGAVLVVARRQPFGRSSARVIADTAAALDLLLKLQRGTAREQRTSQVLAAARLGVFKMLMSSQLQLAQSTMATITPGLLDAEESRVLILQVRPEDRDGAVGECTAATGGRALIVRCPVYDTDVIIVAPVHDRVPEHWEAASAELRQVVAARPDRYLGGSGRLPIGATAQAYRDAAHALAAARLRQSRAALHSAETPLVQVLDQRARRWAETLLRPVLMLRRSECDQLLDILPLVLEFGVAGAAKIAGRHRNTVSALRKRSAGLLGLDLGNVLSRAQLDLSLRIFASYPPAVGSAAPVPLPDLLSTAQVHLWADDWLAPLDGDARELRRTLAAWVGCNTHVEQAAARLGKYPDTVRDHLKVAGSLVQRDLMTPSGAHDPALALLAVGALRMADAAVSPA